MIAALLAAALAFTSADAEIAYTSATNFVASCTPRDAGTIRGRLAAYWILDAASRLGADVRRDTFSAETPNGTREFTNLYASFKRSETNRWVVLVSHFDTKPGSNCPGANDGGSTTGLLISLANMLGNSNDLSGNVLLIWTDAEESIGATYTSNDGFQGSRRAVERIKARESPVQAVICLDMLGDKDLSISLPSNGSATLAKIVHHAARRMGEPDLVKDIPEQVKDDHVAFLDAGYPAVDLIDFSYGPDNSWWHTPSDTAENISQDSLLKSGRLVTEMLNILL